MRILPVQKFILTLALSGLLVLSCGWLFLKLAGSVYSAEANLSLVESKILMLEDDFKNARSLQKTLRNRSTDIENINNFFVDPSSPVTFIEELESLAKATKNIIALEIRDSQKRNILVFGVTLEGSESSVLKFLRLLEVLPYGIEVEDMSYQKLNIESGNLSFLVTKLKSQGVIPVARMVLVINVHTRSPL